uniref:GPAT/DHAPAT C-terminal domain-containing protein n=1 Tax=Caenorhabditis japonica TaxID=281687 RepID=A0A8R1I960_CAEJA
MISEKYDEMTNKSLRRSVFTESQNFKEYLSTMASSLNTYQPRPIRMTKLPAPISYRELVPWHRNHSETVDDRSLIRAIGYHVVYEAQMMCSISPIAVCSCILLGKWREIVPRAVFEQDCQWLSEEIIASGGDVVGYTSRNTTGSEIADYFYKRFQTCVDVNEQTVRIIEKHSSFIQLAYNKNSVMCRFSIKSVIALAIVSRSSHKKLKKEDIIKDTLLLCDWLQFEFLFCRPCDNLNELSETILGANEWTHPVRGLLSVGVENNTYLNSGDFEELETFTIRNQKSLNVLHFFANLVRPFVQSLCIVCSFVTSERCPVIAKSDSSIIRSICQDALSGNISLPFTPLCKF